MFKSFKSHKVEEDRNSLTVSPQGKVEGTIGVVCMDQARYSHFLPCMVDLLQTFPLVRMHVRIGLQLTRARNEIISKVEGEWLWWMDDDHTFKPEMLLHLLRRDVDIVGPLYTMRSMPPQATARSLMLNEQTGENEYVIPHLFNLKPDIYEVDCLGTAGMLVRRRVWEKMTPPYFTVGHVKPDMISEDMYFCDQARSLGFKVYCDTTQVLGHIAPVVMMPVFEDPEWKMHLKFPNGAVQIVCGKVS